MDKELNETRKMMSEQNENTNKEMEIIKRNQTEILELNSKTTKMKNSVEGFGGRCEQAEYRISKLADRTVEITKSEEQKEM